MINMGRIRSNLSVAFASLLTLISPKLNTKFLYWRRFGRKLDLNHPVTSNEKVLWLKFNTYYKNPLIVQCADKYLVRKYVEDCGCGEILNELYGIYDNVDDIDFDTLPNSFVLKCNYGAKMNIICPDKTKLNYDEAKHEMRSWLRSKQHLRMSEIHYAKIPKRIVCEKYLDEGEKLVPEDYKIYCCNGKPMYVMVCLGRYEGYPKFYYFDVEGNIQRNMTRDGLIAPADFKFVIPKGWKEMLHYAELLSRPFPFVRADFYLVDGNVIFGELTFTPAGGLDNGKLPYTDRLLGDLIKLPGK